jgi:2-methylcitrate dehydratase PrpD
MTRETETLAAFVAGIDYSTIPASVLERAVSLVLDSSAGAVRARHDGDSTPALIAGLTDAGIAQGRCGLFGDAATAAPATAALINGMLVHTLDFDDTHVPSSTHTSAPVIPAALAAAQHVSADGKTTLAGIVAGIEVMTRLGRALIPPHHYARGFHPTATTGVFGAAAAAARILGLNAEDVANAFGIGLSSAAGTLQFHSNGAWTKRWQVGQAAANGMTAALMARHHFRGVTEAIEGQHGLIKVYTDDPDETQITAGLGEHWETASTSIKLYPACRFAHAAIDAILELCAENQLSAGDVTSVDIGLSHKALAAVAEPAIRKVCPQNVVDGQFSIYFLVAVAILNGGIGWDDYERFLGDPEVEDLARRVRPVHDDQVQADYPKSMTGRATITLVDGTRLERYVACPKGEPENFPSAETLKAKARGLVLPILGDKGATAFETAVFDIPVGGVDPVFAAAVKAKILV